jgi:hypothetical protein
VVDLLLSQRFRGVPEGRKNHILKPPLLECVSGAAEGRNPGRRIELEDDLL